MNDEEYIKAQISSLERLSKHRTLTSEELHDLGIMKDQLNNESYR